MLYSVHKSCQYARSANCWGFSVYSWKVWEIQSGKAEKVLAGVERELGMLVNSSTSNQLT